MSLLADACHSSKRPRVTPITDAQILITRTRTHTSSHVREQCVILCLGWQCVCQYLALPLSTASKCDAANRTSTSFSPPRI